MFHCQKCYKLPSNERKIERFSSSRTSTNEFFNRLGHYRASRNVSSLFALALIFLVIFSIGTLITDRPCSRKKLRTFSIIFCWRSVPGTTNTLPVGSRFAKGWYVPFSGNKLAGTRAMLSSLTRFNALGGSE